MITVLSYRHHFHAGNFADVLKHVCLLHILEYMTQKDKPLCYIDTHAGAGGYRLASHDERPHESAAGIARLWQAGDLPDAVAAYVRQVKAFNHSPQLHFYPGSPWLARQCLRPADRLFLAELHSSDVRLLRDHCKSDKRVRVFHQDGLQLLLSLLPPAERRALVLIDPSYEIKSDYLQVCDTLVKAWRRFAGGCYALWYPVVDRSRIRRMENTLKQSPLRNCLLLELGVRPDNDPGMTASGMIIINPPWQMADTMQQVLPYLAAQLAGDNGFYRIEWLAGE